MTVQEFLERLGIEFTDDLQERMYKEFPYIAPFDMIETCKPSEWKGLVQLPTIKTYGEYSSDNYGMNTVILDMPSIRLYYSYDTIVAYSCAGDGLVVCENVWGTTTGKHLNWIHPDHSRRLDRNEFEDKLYSALSKLSIVERS